MFKSEREKELEQKLNDLIEIAGGFGGGHHDWEAHTLQIDVLRDELRQEREKLHSWFNMVFLAGNFVIFLCQVFVFRN